MSPSFEHGSCKIATIIGIPIRVHFSWLIIFSLITWSLSSFYFPKVAPELPRISYWTGSILASLLLFLSVAFHEISHSLVAKSYRITIQSITLFIFGGVASMKGEPPNPKAEFRIAMAGPLSSFVLAVVFYILYLLSFGPIMSAIFVYLFRLNLVLGIFNLIPGFPMDGGRVVRAFLWQRSKDFFNATRRASILGQRIAIFFIIFGLFSLFTGFTGGLWIVLIGWFLHTAAQTSYQQASLEETLRGVKVRDIMVRDVVALSPDVTIDKAVNDFFLRYGYGGFPVVRQERFLGFLTLKEIKNVPRDRWQEVNVSEVFLPHNSRWEVSEDDDALKALEIMISEDTGRLIVLKDGRIEGLITRNGIARFVQIMGK